MNVPLRTLQDNPEYTVCAGWYRGYPTFVISIMAIGLCTAVIGDVAGHLGCFIYLKDSVNAIAFVALGTSVPGKGDRDCRENNNTKPNDSYLAWVEGSISR